MSKTTMSGNCPRCGAPLTPSGNCVNLCGGAYAPLSVAVLERPAVDPLDLREVPTDVLTAWVDWKALERTMSTPGPKYCFRCGTPNPAEAQYCSNCRAQLPY